MTKLAIGAQAVVKWIDETFHPEHEVDTHKVYISFSDEPDFSACKGNEVDDYGVHDSNIFTYMESEKALQDYIDYPDESFAVLGYDLVYSVSEIKAV